MDHSLKYPIVEIRGLSLFGHTDISTFLSAWNFKGFRKTKQEKVTVIDSAGKKYIMSEAEEIRNCSAIRWWFDRLLGRIFEYRFRSVVFEGEIPLQDFKALVIDIINANHTFYNSGGEITNIIDDVEKAATHQEVMNVVM